MKGLHMKVATGYIALKGSRRRYYDMVRHEVISRRQYLKRQGIFPCIAVKIAVRLGLLAGSTCG